MQPKIVDREIIKLSDTQTRMIKSGWGEAVLSSTVVEKITYLSDELKVKGYIAYPADDSKKYPCIIWNRGGYNDKGSIDIFTARGIYGQLASWGYVVFASQYRGNAGSEGKEELGGDDVNDILNLIPLAEEIPSADSSRWGIEGWSRGGMMTFLTLLKNNYFKCAVVSGAITNIHEYAQSNSSIKNFYENILGQEKLKLELKKRNIIDKAEKLPKIPYLLLHGGEDETIPVNQSLELALKFTQLDFDYKLVVFEKGDHFLKTHRKEVDALRKKWFHNHLG